MAPFHDVLNIYNNISWFILLHLLNQQSHAESDWICGCAGDGARCLANVLRPQVRLKCGQLVRHRFALFFSVKQLTEVAIVEAGSYRVGQFVVPPWNPFPLYLLGCFRTYVV